MLPVGGKTPRMLVFRQKEGSQLWLQLDGGGDATSSSCSCLGWGLFLDPWLRPWRPMGTGVLLLLS